MEDGTGLLMLPLLLSASLLAGIASSHRMGESGPGLAVSADTWLGTAVRLEAGLDTIAKVETGDGWSARGAADYSTGPITLGLGYTHRHTSAWSKDVLWARAGVQHGAVWLLASIAPDSPNMEAKLEARIRLRHRWAVVEPRLWVGTHSTVEELGGFAYGASCYVGWAH